MNAPAQIEAAVRTTCPYCGVGCGLIAQPDGRGGAAIAGDPAHPANFGASARRARRSARRSASTADCCIRCCGRPTARFAAPAGTRRSTRWRTASAASSIATDPDAVAFYLSGQLLTEDYYVANKLMKGFHRLGQCRHQFAAVHGVLGRRPPPRLRRRHRARQLRRSRRGRPHRAGRLQRRLVPSGAVPAHDAQPGRARRAHRRHRSAPHRDRRGGRSVSADRAGHRHGAVLRPARRISPNAARSTTGYIDAHTTGFADALARAREIAPDIAATARATGLDGSRRRALLRSVPRDARASSPAIRKA